MITCLKWKHWSLKIWAMHICALILSELVYLLHSLFLNSFNNLNSIYSTGIYGNNHDIKTWPLADLSGYFVIGFNPSNIAKICKYTFSSSSAQCQTISNINTGYGHLMISNSQFFVLGADSASPYNLHIYKITFLSTSVDWANKIACSSGTWIVILFRICAELWRIYNLLVLHIRSQLNIYTLQACLCPTEVLQLRGSSQVYLYQIYMGQLWTETTSVSTISRSCLHDNIQHLDFNIYNQVLLWLALRGWAVEPSSGR